MMTTGALRSQQNGPISSFCWAPNETDTSVGLAQDYVKPSEDRTPFVGVASLTRQRD